MIRSTAGWFALSAIPLSFTALAIPSWWQSPAFGRTGMSVFWSGLFWLFGGAVLFLFWARGHVKPSLLVFSLACYGIPTTLMGISVVWFTVEANAVSAVGSAIMWMTVGLQALHALTRIAVQIGQEEV